MAGLPHIAAIKCPGLVDREELISSYRRGGNQPAALNRA